MTGKKVREHGFDAWLERVGDRFCEPFHLNLLSALVNVFGGYRSKVTFDLVRRRHYAYSVLRAADLAHDQNLRSVTIAEFGVATGAGLLNLCKLAELTTAETGIEVRVMGFDTGRGLPPPIDYRDHPELFQEGDYPMDFKALAGSLPSNGRLVLGPLSETVPEFIKKLDPESPLGFAAIDVDYYSSAKDALHTLSDPNPEKYLPLTLLYLDDITAEFQNQWCGELLAMNEFNSAESWRKIETDRFLKSRRVFKGARWLEQIHLMHVLDHPLVRVGQNSRARKEYPALSSQSL
jgi:hypothetical protein